MKEKILMLSKGDFDDNKPEITVSEPVLHLETECGSKVDGSFAIRSLNGCEIRAMIYSSQPWMTCDKQTFIGLEGKIGYTLDTGTFETGELLKGYFTIVSNAGELQIPYEVLICAPFCESTMGAISEMDQFAALAREDWQEALRIFRSADFEKVFLHSDRHRRLYRALMESRSASMAMDEFLCAMKKKQRSSIHVSQDLIEYENPEDTIAGTLLIERSSWGCLRADVRCEGDFISLFKCRLSEDDFLGSYCKLEYRLTPGRALCQEGAIILETMDQLIRVPVRLRRDVMISEKQQSRRSLRRSLIDLQKLYISYRLQKISKSRWLSESGEAISGCINNSQEPVFQVAEAAWQLMAGDRETAGNILAGINGRQLRYQSVIYYCFYLYINSLYREDEHYTRYVADTIRFYAEGQYSERWELIYFADQLTRQGGGESRYRQQAHTYGQLKEIAEKSGMIAPGIFLNAVSIVNEDPSLIREIGDFEQKLLVWGARHDCLSRETVFRYADLAPRVRHWMPAYADALKHYCEIYQTKELLAAVIRQLILGGQNDARSHHWYRLGIESSLRLPELYESFMDSLDLNSDEELPVGVLVYYQYDNKLDAGQKAYLYRYLLERRESYARLFESYDSIIRTFALGQLQQGQMTADLAVLYRYYLTGDTLTRHVLEALPDILFKHQLKLDDQVRGITAVIVDYAELNEELYYPVVSGKAYIDLFMDDYRILFEDKEGNRYLAGSRSRTEPLLDMTKYIRECYPVSRHHRLMVMNRSERALKYQLMDDESVEVYKSVLKLEHVSKQYQKTVLRNLIDYYYDNYEGETLEKYLLQIDINLLGNEERGHIIEYFIQRGLYERAYNAIRVYGDEGVQDKHILRLSSRLIREKGYARDPMMIALAYSAFEHGKYDEVTLKYLILFYEGPTKDLYKLWMAARDFEVPASEMEERLLSQILFAETMIPEGCDILASYYGAYGMQRLTKAFLAYAAYHYLDEDAAIGSQVFHIMEIELGQMENVRKICSLALTRYYAENKNIRPGYYDWIGREIAGFIDEGILLPWFVRFSGCGAVPSELTDLTYLTWHDKPGKKLTLICTDAGSGTAQELTMDNPAAGIYVRALRLLPGKTVSYRIVSEDGKDTLTQGSLTGGSGAAEARQRNGMSELARMHECMDYNDDIAMDEAMLEYEKLDEMTDRLFSLH